MLTPYHAIPSRSSVVRWMLEEVGEPTRSGLWICRPIGIML